MNKMFRVRVTVSLLIEAPDEGVANLWASDWQGGIVRHTHGDSRQTIPEEVRSCTFLNKSVVVDEVSPAELQEIEDQVSDNPDGWELMGGVLPHLRGIHGLWNAHENEVRD